MSRIKWFRLSLYIVFAGTFSGMEVVSPNVKILLLDQYYDLGPIKSLFLLRKYSKNAIWWTVYKTCL